MSEFSLRCQPPEVDAIDDTLGQGQRKIKYAIDTSRANILGAGTAGQFPQAHWADKGFHAPKMAKIAGLILTSAAV